VGDGGIIVVELAEKPEKKTKSSKKRAAVCWLAIWVKRRTEPTTDATDRRQV